MIEQVNQEKLFVDGQWIETNEKLQVYNKFTGDLLSEISIADEKTVDKAIEAGVSAHENTSYSFELRYSSLMKVATLLLENQKSLGAIIAKEGGKPITDALIEVKRSAETFQMAATEVKKLIGEIIPNYNAPDRFLYTIKKPVGVVAAITPFNFPLNLVVHKVAPALAAGNPIIIKPASETPSLTIRLCELLQEAGVPNGYVQCVIGGGSTVGEQLLKDQRIAHYTFTGSPGVGKHIQKTIGLRKATLELGSNSATIVHCDANVVLAAKKLAIISFAHAGQICISVQRIYIHEDVQKKFMEIFLEEVAKLNVGNPLLVDTNVGPMVNEKEAKRLENWILEATESGAIILAGGTREKTFLHRPF